MPKRSATRPPAAQVLAWLARLSEQSLAEHGLTLPQYIVLDTLWHLESSASELAEGLQVTSGTVTSTVDRLASRGLVRRSEDPADRRRVLHHLTDAGRTLLVTADHDLDAGFGRLASRLGVERTDELERWSDAIERAIHDAIPRNDGGTA